MSRLYDALKNAQASLPAAASPFGRRSQPQLDDAPAFLLLQAIDNRLAERPRRVIQVVGCGPHEDVAGVARRLAALSAQGMGRRTLLLDAQTPPLGHKSHPGHPAVGGLPAVAALEAGRPRRPDDGLPFSVESLFDHAQGAGGDPRALCRAWETLRQSHDLIIVESPPMSTPLGLALAPTVDGVVLVVEANRTPIDRAEAAREALFGGGANLLGVVLDKHRHWVPQGLWERC